MATIEIKPVQIAAHYAMMAGMMRDLHINEKVLNDKTAHWDDIEAGYMRHVIAMQEECDGQCLVAYVDGEPAGFIFGYAEEPDDSRIEEYTGKELYVSDGYIKPEYRRMGIYKMLNGQLEQYYRDMGVKRIIRFTMVNNDGMRSLLEREGYRVTRVLYEKWL